MLIGYGRVSTADQSPDLQRDALLAYGVSPLHLFIETVSGRQKVRPAFERAKTYLRKDDTLVVWKVDRLGRSLADLVGTMQYLYEHDVHLKVLTGIDLDTTKPTDRAVFGFLAVMAEFEHALMHERTLAGLAAARARGRVGGRRHVLSPEQVRLARQMLAGGMSKTAIAQTLGCSRSTMYRSLGDAPGLSPTPPAVQEYRNGVGV